MVDTDNKPIRELQNEEKTINQLRAEYDLSPIEGGDQLLITKEQSCSN